MTMKNVNNQKLCQIISYFLWISHFSPLELIFSSFSSMAYFFSVLIFNFFNVSLYFLYLRPYFCPHDQINKIICEQIIFPWVLLSKCFPSDVCFHLDSCPQACSMALTVDILSWFLCWTHCVLGNSFCVCSLTFLEHVILDSQKVVHHDHYVFDILSVWKCFYSAFILPW